ncbi:MAG: hypothetical protein H0U57_01190 [Tatlockia sp.]|nr:hypothetical protein [Tatlockia sp.]
MNERTEQAIKELLLNKIPLADQEIEAPYDYASLRECILQAELKQEIEELKYMLLDQSTFEENFKKRCALREIDKEKTIPFQSMPKNSTNELYWRIAELVFQPETMQDMLEIVLPSVQKQLKVDLDYASGINNPTPTLELLDNLDEFKKQEPTIDTFMHYIFAEGILFDTRGIECFALRQQSVLQNLLNEKHPLVCDQLYSHNTSLQGLTLDILTLNQKGITPKAAIEQLIKGLILGGEKMTGQQFAGKLAKDAVDRFFAWFNALPNHVQEQLRTLDGDHTTLGSIIDNELGKGTCVETAAAHLNSILQKHSQEPILTLPPEMKPLDLKALRDKYGPKKPLDTKKDSFIKSVFPTQLTKEVLERINPKTDEQLISLILDFPPCFYDDLWQNIKFDNFCELLLKLPGFFKAGYFNAEQKQALAKAVTNKLQGAPLGFLLLAVTTNDIVFLNEDLYASRDSRIIGAIFNDNRLKEAIHRSGKKQFSKELAHDLIVLYQFHQDYNSTLSFYVEECTESINNFYEKALDIRLSGAPIKIQAQKITAAANEEFKHRHKDWRLLADALMLISILFGGLGLIIMAGRYCTNNTVFFSQEKTNRAQKFHNQYMKYQNEIDDLAEESDPDSVLLSRVNFLL